MPDLIQNKYRIPTNRLPRYDYGADGWYFVTICTKNRVHYFGDIVRTHHRECDIVETRNCASLQYTETGTVAHDFWLQIPQHYPFVQLDTFVIMPDHIHGILCFNNPDKTDWSPNVFGPQSQNLGAVIRAFKSSVKRHTNQNNIPFSWQSRFYDRIIRDQDALDATRHYIALNPAKWAADKPLHM
jgi:REP element-mobilizing transposase RayT